jgi:hypothetical protein
MSVSNNDTIANALERLKVGLGPFTEREIKAHFGQQWQAEVSKALSGTRLNAGNTSKLSDVAAQLVVMDRLWGSVFRNVLGRTERSLVNELLDVRNRWAHQEAFSVDDTDRALDSIYRLLNAVGASLASEVRAMKLSYREKSFGGPALNRSGLAASTQARRRVSDGNVLPDQKTRILNFVAQFPGRDDDEIAAALEISPRQTVNQVCRKLCKDNLLRRERGARGKLVNFCV